MFKFIKNIFQKNGKNEYKFEIVTTVSVNNEPNPSRELLKDATTLKYEGKYNEACEKLKEAFNAKGSESLTVKERMRLAMYLQLAKKSEEGWQVLKEINEKYTDVFSQADIANQMRIFLQKEKLFREAIIFSIWTLCKEIERDKYNIKICIENADRIANNPLLQRIGRREKETVYGRTPEGNPITDKFYKILNDRINEKKSREGIEKTVEPLLKKMKKENFKNEIADSISNYFSKSENYELKEIEDIIDLVLT